MDDTPFSPAPVKGRGAAGNPPNRFESMRWEPIAVEAFPDDDEFADDPATPRAPHGPATIYLRDTSRTIIARNDSPDIPFDASINPYRGCEHGCIYCYARPTHEYLGFSAGLDFESRIMVKMDAPELLRRELAARSWRPQLLGMSGVTDCYQPVERRLRLTRGCLEVLAERRNPVGIVTKNQLVLRDLDLLADLASWGGVRVFVSVTTLDPDLTATLEPRAARPAARLETIRRLAAAGVPVGVMVAPVIPGLNDREIPAILEAAAAAGASTASWIMLRLPHAVAPLFEKWLGDHLPARRDRILARIRDVRGGALSSSRFGTRMRGEGIVADQVAQLFRLAARRHGLDRPIPALRTDAFRRAGGEQLELFG